MYQYPDRFKCPITSMIMREPVTAADGNVYEKEAIERWFEDHDTSPVTNVKLENLKVLPQQLLQTEIGRCLEEHPELITQDEVYCPFKWWLAVQAVFEQPPGNRKRQALRVAMEFARKDIRILQKSYGELKRLYGCWPANNRFNNQVHIRAGDKNGRTLLYSAAGQGEQEYVVFLLRAGSNVNARKTDSNGASVLDVAVAYGRLQVVRRLLEIGLSNQCNPRLNVNITDNSNRTPLHIITLCNEQIDDRVRCEMAQLLLDNGANLEAKNNEGRTPLHCATSKKNKPLIKFLMENGANIRSRRNNGSFAMGGPGMHMRDEYRDISRFAEELMGEQISRNHHSNRQLRNEVMQLRDLVRAQQQQIQRLTAQMQQLSRRLNQTQSDQPEDSDKSESMHFFKK